MIKNIPINEINSLALAQNQHKHHTSIAAQAQKLTTPQQLLGENCEIPPAPYIISKNSSHTSTVSEKSATGSQSATSESVLTNTQTHTTTNSINATHTTITSSTNITSTNTTEEILDSVSENFDETIDSHTQRSELPPLIESDVPKKSQNHENSSSSDGMGNKNNSVPSFTTLPRSMSVPLD